MKKLLSIATLTAGFAGPVCATTQIVTLSVPGYRSDIKEVTHG